MGELDQKAIQNNIESNSKEQGDISESLSKLLDTLADEDKNILFSELTEREIKHLSVIATVGDNDEITQQFIKNFTQMKVSKNRQGRGELVRISEAFSGVFETQNEGRIASIKDRLGF